MWPALRLLFRWVAACSVIANRLPKRLGKQTTNCYLAHPLFLFFCSYFYFWQLTSLGFLSRFGSSSAWVEADPTANLAGKTRSQFLCKPKQKHVGRLLLICLADRRLLISDLRSLFLDRIMFMACWRTAKGSPFSPFGPIVSHWAATGQPRICENLFDLLGLAIGCLTPN